MADLLRTTPEGEGIVSILELSDVMDQPRLFSHVHAVDARPAVRDAARGGRPAQAEAVLLLRRGAPAVRRRLAGAARRDRADGPTDPLEGGRGLLRHAGADRRPVAGPGPARQPRPARAARVHARRRRRAAQDRPDLPDDRPSTTSRRRSPRSGPARRWSPSCRHAACRRRSPRPGCWRPIRSMAAARRGPVRRPDRDQPVRRQVRRHDRPRQRIRADQRQDRRSTRRGDAGGHRCRRPGRRGSDDRDRAQPDDAGPAAGEINRQAKEIAAAQKAAERERKAQEKAAADAAQGPADGRSIPRCGPAARS